MQTLPKGPATLTDVARAAGVSVAAASRAINGRAEVRPATRERVLKASEALGYVPNTVARALKTGRSRMLALVVSSGGQPGYTPILEGAEEYATSHGYGITFYNSGESQERALDNLAALSKSSTAGVLLTPVQTDQRDIKQLRKSGTPFVLIARHFPNIDSPYVISNNTQAARIVTDHLIATGHRRIAHIGGPAHVSTSQERLLGYQAGLAAAGMKFDERLVIFAPFTVAGGYEAANALLSRRTKPTAIFAATDLQAIGVMRAAKEHGLRIPNDLAVAGGDDTDLAAALPVTLTSFHLPIRDMGRLGTEMLINLIEGRKIQSKHIMLEPELLIRESTAL